MGASGGPKLKQRDNLVFHLDSAHHKSVDDSGGAGYTNANQLVRDLISPSVSITNGNNVRLGNKTFFTIYSQTYPESSHNPDGASGTRDGITPGFNNITSSEVLDFSRDLNYAVWNNRTNDWVADSYFNGERKAGHCYDTYDTGGNAATEHVQFQRDYRRIRATFKDATHIVCGSHAAENNDSDSDTLAILQDLGGPSSWPSGRAEYILVGRPRLGAGNAFIWAHENVSSTIAHANVGLPIRNKKQSENYLQFDGTGNQYLTLPNSLGYTSDSGVSVFAWFRRTSNSSVAGNYHVICGHDALELSIHTGSGFLRNGVSVNGTRYVQNDGSAIGTNTWHCVGLTWENYTKKAYVDGNLVGTQTTGSSGSLSTSFTRELGRYTSTYALKGDLATYSVYAKALTHAEIKKNFNTQRRRFGV